MPRPSITYWNRIEPSPRSDSLMRGLEAAVRDPVWFLARQWQMGEFRGEDAGSPSTVSFRASLSPFKSWKVADQPANAFVMEAPLETLMENEATTQSWFIAVELGQMLARMLLENGASASTIALFRNAYPVLRPAALTPNQLRDEALVRFLRISGDRSIDGIAALEAAIRSTPSVPSEVNLPSGTQEDAASNALQAFMAWARSVYGAIGREDGPAWSPHRLDYDVEVTAQTPSGHTARLHTVPGSNAEFDWYAFDEIAPVDEPPAEGSEEHGPEALAFSLFPSNVSFSGMPNSRWWQFEDSRFNWTNVDVDRRDIAKTMILDFMLVQGNDWFLVPFGHRVGSLVAIDQLLVSDVFGEYTLIRRADALEGSEGARWTMFSTASDTDGHDRTADYFVLPPSVLRTTLDGPDLEEVRFLRDEQANLIWGIEAYTENGLGRPWAGHERALAYAEERPAQMNTTAPLRYRLQTHPPVHWIPFPPVQIDAARRSVALERAAIQRFIDGTLARVEPVGRVLRPTNLEDIEVYRVNEEEVTRSGTRIVRAVRRTRWIDGSTHLWTSRRRRAGFGEGASGLRYDLAEQTGADVQT